MSRSRLLQLPALLLLVLVAPVPGAGPGPSSAWAQPADPAKELVREGNRFYKQRQFEQALRRYQQAFALRPTAIVVYNMGQCLRELGQHNPAVFQFRIFLAMAPDAPNAAQVKELIAELERAAREAGQRPGSVLPAPPPPTVAPVTAGITVEASADASPQPVRWYRRWYVWVPIALAVAGGAAGGAIAATRGGGPAPPMLELGTKRFFGGGP